MGRGRDLGDDRPPEDHRARRDAIDADWLEDELAELERLVEEGDTLEVVSRLRGS